MSDEIEVTPEETEAEARARVQQESMRNLVVSLNERAEDQAVDKFMQMLDGFSNRETDATRNVQDAIEDVAPAPTRAPALSAARTRPAELTDMRYRKLPAWQREFRTPDGDYQVARFFRAVAANDQLTLRTIAAEDKLARAEMTEGVLGANGAPYDGTVGQLLPLPISNYLMEAVYKAGRMRGVCRVFPTQTGASLRIPVQSLESSSSWTAELAQITEGGPSADDALNLSLHKHANIAVVSNEVLADEVFGVVQWLLADAMNEMVEAEDLALYQTGTASGQPKGFESYDATITGATANPVYYVKGPDQTADNIAPTDINLAHLNAMFYRLPEKERRNAIWMASGHVAEILSNLVDLTGRPVLRMQNDAAGVVGDSEAGAQTTTILGRPFVEMPGKVDLGATPAQDENRLYFGNMPRTYIILEQGGIQVASTSEGGSVAAGGNAFDTDSTHFRFIRRLDGQSFNNPLSTSGRYQYVYTGGIKGVV